MSKSNEAVELFNQGYNCSQAVFSVYSDELGIDKKIALKIAHGFGAGMGKLQEVCGAVTGAFMVLSLKYGSAAANDTVEKERIYGLIREFAHRFEKRNKTIICKKILEADLINDDRAATTHKVKAICPEMIKNAIEILAELGQEEMKNEV